MNEFPRMALAGAAVLAIHVIGANWLIGERSGPPLTVKRNATEPRRSVVTSSPPDRARLTVDGEVIDATEPMRPGLRYLQWTETYRGGFIRSVGTSHRVGARQAPATPPCSIRLRIGQSLLDDGKASEGTVAHTVGQLLEEQLRGTSQWPIGSFERIESLSLAWATGGGSPRAVLGTTIDAPPENYIALHADVVFTRLRLPIFIALVPTVSKGAIALRALASAKIVANNRIVRTILEWFDGNRRATAIAQSEVGAAIVDLLAPPPPIKLEGGGQIQIAFCSDQPMRFVDRAYGELPLAIALESAESPGPLPLSLSEPPQPTPKSIASDVELSIDLDGLGALLHQAWASGYLDRQLQLADLTGKFNRAPAVTAMLSVRARSLSLSGPPVIEENASGGLSLGAELSLRIDDGDAREHARLFIRGGFALTRGGNQFIERLGLGDVGLTCIPSPGVLRACYSTLVSELRRRAPAADEIVQTWLEKALIEILSDRELSIEGVPAALTIGAPRARFENGAVHIDFDASLVRDSGDR